MARAVADPWRLRVLAEVGIRPLSPSQFVERFGGDLNHVSRCFRQLAKWDYVEIVERRPGSRRGASIEHVYKAVRRAHFDTTSWNTVPQGERETATRTILSSYQDRIRAAFAAGTFDQEIDRHVSWDVAALDRIAWQSLGERLDGILSALPNHELQSAKRLEEAEGESIPTTVSLAAFRSPESPEGLLHGANRQQGSVNSGERDALFAIGPKLAKALSNHWRCRIIAEVGLKPLSPSQFVEEFGGSMTNISRCFRELARWGFLEVHEERRGGRRGGGVERIYRSTRRAYFDAPTWEALPLIVRSEISTYFLTTFFERVNAAIKAGTFDADLDRHLSWRPVRVDRAAWNTIGQSLDEVLAWLPQLETEALERVDDAKDLMATTVGLASFRSPAPL
ncbi:MAG TPA: hypothetical protein VFN92_12420 [Solirubrobacterales bacterium]|nr:hypothetical protein [Solirubrobacterales bacterium]